jgi:hypothetical protein
MDDSEQWSGKDVEEKGCGLWYYPNILPQSQ